MPEKRDYYDVLGVKRDANPDEIRKAYRGLARRLHPDVNKAADAAAKFSELQEAYDVLADPERRKKYNQFGHAGVGPTAAGVGSGPGRENVRSYTWHGPGAGGGMGGMGAEDLASIFEQFMGSRSSGFAGKPPRTSARPGAQSAPAEEVETTIPFMTAARGGTARVRIARPNGAFEEVDVRVPKGVDSGARLRLRARGRRDPISGKPGDLVLRLKVAPHAWLRRDGLDVSLDVPVTFVEAIAGTSIEVPLLEGTAKVQVPPGSSSGRNLRLKGRGIEDAKGRKGDLLVVIQIVVPEELSAADLKAVQDIGQRLKNPRESAAWVDKMP